MTGPCLSSSSALLNSEKAKFSQIGCEIWILLVSVIETVSYFSSLLSCIRHCVPIWFKSVHQISKKSSNFRIVWNSLFQLEALPHGICATEVRQRLRVRVCCRSIKLTLKTYHSNLWLCALLTSSARRICGVIGLKIAGMLSSPGLDISPGSDSSVQVRWWMDRSPGSSLGRH